MSNVCERPGGGAPGGGLDASSDTGADASSSGTAGCLQRWLMGGPSLALSQPQPLAITSTAFEDRDPWISADGLRLYFDRNPGPQGGIDLHFSARAPTDAEFTITSSIVNLNTSDD